MKKGFRPLLWRTDFRRVIFCGPRDARRGVRMRIFVAGASGVVGARLVPLLVANGHHVVATTRTPSKLDALRRQGAAPVVLDALDRNAVVRAVEAARPEVVVHEMTAIASLTSLRHFDEAFAPTNRLRT